MQTLQVIDEYKQAINAAIENFMTRLPQTLGLDMDDVSVHTLDTIAKLREYTMRPGKRVRGFLAAAVYDETKGTHLAPAGLALSVAQELIQSYLLIIDDITDKSAVRRGKPSVHIEYLLEKDAFGDEHEANMLAMYVGMIAQHVANIALLQATERSEHIVNALQAMHEKLTITSFGQIDDVYHKVGRTVSEQDIVRSHAMKTGYYTCINPLLSGMSLGGVHNEAVERHVVAFGRAAGIAFQLHDDYLGVYGDMATTGKPNVDDIKEGKYTVLVHYALTHGDEQERAAIHNLLGNQTVIDKDMQRIRQIFDKTGATLYVQEESVRYAAAAKKHLDSIDIWSDSFKRLLSDLVDFAVERNA